MLLVLKAHSLYLDIYMYAVQHLMLKLKITTNWVTKHTVCVYINGNMRNILDTLYLLCRSEKYYQFMGPVIRRWYSWPYTAGPWKLGTLPAVLLITQSWIVDETGIAAKLVGKSANWWTRLELLLFNSHRRRDASRPSRPDPLSRGSAWLWLGGQCHLAAGGEENFENLTTKWCILKYIWINMWSA